MDIQFPDAADRVEKIAVSLLRDEPAFLTSRGFGPCVAQGRGRGPALLLGDQSEISLMSNATPSHLEYRMALLAGSGDHVVVRTRNRAFENYLCSHLGVCDVTFHEAPADGFAPLAQHLRTSACWAKKMAGIAMENGGLTIKAYLTTGHLWHLARVIGEKAGCVVHVCGPAPRVAKRANDKLWFTRLVQAVVGPSSTPPTQAAYGPAAAAALVKRISADADQVIVKVPDSAGSAGNLRLESARLRHQSTAEIRHWLLHRLRATGWQDTYPVLVGVWDKNVICSPSVQLWLGHVSQGPPRVEGVFEQRVQTSAATFSGAVPSDLNPDIRDRLTSQAIRVAEVLQRLGYYGRCSFDAVLCAGEERDTIHWIECNGRWGGVSLPMTASRHHAPAIPAQRLAIVQERRPDLDLDMGSLLERLGDLLLQKGRREDGLIVMSPPDHADGALLNLCAVAQSQSAANAILGDAMDRLVVKKHP